jgi:hypothetical protein
VADVRSLVVHAFVRYVGRSVEHIGLRFFSPENKSVRTYGLECARGFRGAGTSQRTSGPYLSNCKFLLRSSVQGKNSPLELKSKVACSCRRMKSAHEEDTRHRSCWQVSLPVERSELNENAMASRFFVWPYVWRWRSELAFLPFHLAEISIVISKWLNK